MQRYEARFKRKRSFQDAPRTLDIDILFIKHKQNEIYSKDPKLILPHPGWDKRESVLIPLTYFKYNLATIPFLNYKYLNNPIHTNREI